MKSALIKNGTVNIENKLIKTDLLIDNGIISDIGEFSNADDIIDAEGLYILPGFIDIHTHLGDNIGNYNLADTYKSGSEIAIKNGITTLFSFITQNKNDKLSDSINKAINKAKGNSYCDYMWHLTPTRFNDNEWKDIETFINKGFKTFKFYTTYKSAGIYSSYDNLKYIFERLSKYDITLLVHCEDNDTIDSAYRNNNYNLNNAFNHSLLRPAEAEVAAVEKVLDLAKKYNIKLHIVHVSTSDGADLIYKSKNNQKVTCETAPHYLFLNDDYLNSENGYRWICSPPLRNYDNVKSLKEKAVDGYFDIYATDHCAFYKKDKDENSDITKVPNGLAGIGALPHLIFKLYNDNFSNAVIQMSKRLSENPAKITGVFPKKGIIRIGSDADLVIINLNGKERNIQSSLSDVYETYPDFKTKLNIEYVFLRGEKVVRENEIINKKDKTGNV